MPVKWPEIFFSPLNWAQFDKYVYLISFCKYIQLSWFKRLSSPLVTGLYTTFFGALCVLIHVLRRLACPCKCYVNRSWKDLFSPATFQTSSLRPVCGSWISPHRQWVDLTTLSINYRNEVEKTWPVLWYREFQLILTYLWFLGHVRCQSDVFEHCGFIFMVKSPPKK